MKIEPNGISLNETGWTLSVWVKNLIPPKENAQSTLFRGQDRQNDFEFDHYLTLHQSDLQIGFIDGDEPVEEARFKGSGHTLQPFQLDGWNHLAVLGEGARTKYFVNGVFVGQANLRDQSDLYYIGNSSGDELFAEYIDDLRIYGNSLSHAEIGSIYGGGYGDMFTSIKIEENSTIGQSPRVFDLSMGKDAKLIAVNDLNSSWMVLPYGNISDINASENNSSYRIAINTDASKTMHTLEVPELPIRFESLSLWLDASDPQGGSFSIDSNNVLNLWLDASDATTVTKVIGSDDLESWQNKINPGVEMKSWSNRPSFDENINGLTALDIDSVNGQREGFSAYHNGAKWNPAGENGQASGPLTDVALFMAWRVDTNKRTSFPFNWGMGDHLPWENGWVYWRYSGNNRTQSHLANNGKP